jgi:hypothetical protein
MPVTTTVVLALVVAIATAFAVAVAWTHARPAGSLPAPVGNRPRRRPF